VAEGNFVVTASEGTLGGEPTAFFDLFRVEDGWIVEHWDVISTIPSEMAHENGKF
jgi:predicted SnoaL-like aldol condensation-catalyzing enzyme